MHTLSCVHIFRVKCFISNFTNNFRVSRSTFNSKSIINNNSTTNRRDIFIKPSSNSWSSSRSNLFSNTIVNLFSNTTINLFSNNSINLVSDNSIYLISNHIRKLACNSSTNLLSNNRINLPCHSSTNLVCNNTANFISYFRNHERLNNITKSTVSRPVIKYSIYSILKVECVKIRVNIVLKFIESCIKLINIFFRSSYITNSIIKIRNYFSKKFHITNTIIKRKR